ncbi:MAG TPA: hypothetical protein VKV18_08400, partial [Chthonomonas sp.]|uniref:hypothetical protein n=1 Tax=Chthonomonas sp. TaxID=2282153 RepID=UPI002B4B35D7
MAEQSEFAQLRHQIEVESSEEGSTGEIKFEEGYTWKVFFGTLFVAFVMLPGAIYLGLVAGQGLGPAAEWVTIVLFSEIMRRSFLPMKRQEIYILYYVAASLTGLDPNLSISGGPFGYLVWNQYFEQSPQAAPIAHDIPRWVVPPIGSPALIHRTFLDTAWLVPIVLLLIGQVLGRFQWMSAGYYLFRITSDIERLPFPMAPVAASGATALADAASKEESWRWRIFSIGTMVGLVFGFLYIAIPVFSSVAFGKAFQLLPIPFFDFTTNTENILPAAITGITADLGSAMAGFVIPYPIVLGSFWGSIICRILLAPILYHFGLFGNATNSGWTPGMNAIITMQVTNIKFWISVGIGLNAAVAAIGIWSVGKALIEAQKERKNRGLQQRSFAIPKGRGDEKLPMWLPLVIWIGITIFYIFLVEYLLSLDSKPGQPHFINPLWLVFFGLIWSPFNSYISARMIGLTGSGVSVPYLQQVAILKSGYPYVDIWYAPIPLNDFGGIAQRFRELELTGTRFTSLFYAEMVMLVVILSASFIFWAFLWHTSQIPSSQFPYAAKFWPINATFQAIFQQINLKHGAMAYVREAIDFKRIAYGFLAGMALFGLFRLFGWSTLTYYGFIGGSGAYPNYAIMTFIGAWLGKRYFAKR